MKKISIEYLKNEDYVDYIDGDLFLIEDVNKLPTIRTGAIEVDSIIVIFCLNGEGKVSMNGEIYCLHRNQLLLGMPRAVYAYYSPITPDFQVKIIGISTRSFNSSIFMTKNIWKNFYFLVNNPVIDVGEEDVKLLSHYYELANAKMHGTRSVFHQAIMMSLLHCVIFELLNITDRVEKLELNENEHMTQSDVLFKNFIELLAENEGRVRSVQEYAYILNVSSKYLSSIVKQISGRTALDLIHETTTHSIVRQLKYTDKSIKEIATDMKFPSLSFFGKFVKSQLGVSPKKFRKGN